MAIGGEGEMAEYIAEELSDNHGAAPQREP